jgi:hypothetical protein
MSNVETSPAAVANTPAALTGPTLAGPTLAGSSVTGNSPTVALFQKAHAKMITLQRVDEQVQNLLDQRKKLHDELRGIQSQINDEFDRLLNTNVDEPLPKLSADVKSPKRGGKDTLRMEVAEAV